jgi:phage baseplate assembly protein V
MPASSFDYTSYNQLRLGRVVKSRMGTNGPEVQLQIPDRDNLITGWLPVAQPLALGTGTFMLPRKGTMMLSAHLGTGIERGVALCSFYTGVNPCFTPSTENCIAIGTANGQYIELQPDNGIITLTGWNTINITTNNMANSIGTTLTETIGTNLTETIGGNQSTTVKGTYVVNVTGNATIVAPNITLQGNVEITKNLHVEGTSQFDSNINVTGNGNATGEWIDSTGAGVAAT